jgi:hypothetical protein
MKKFLTLLSTLARFGIASGLLLALLCGKAAAVGPPFTPPGRPFTLPGPPFARPDPPAVPEIDPSLVSGGLAMLAGVVLLGQRLRRRER